MSGQAVDSDMFKKQFWENAQLMDERAIIFLDFYAQDLINRAKLDEIQVDQHDNISLLDLCTGTGLIAFKLYNATKDLGNRINIEAIDFSSPMIKFAKEKRDLTQATTVNFQEMDGQVLKFDSESFDFAFSNAGVCFYPDFIKGFKELHRVLKKGGEAFINAWTSDFPMAIPLQIAQKHGTMQGGGSMNFLTLSNPEKFKELLTKSGFSQISMETVPYKMKVKFGNFVESFNGNPFLLEEKVITDIALTFNVKDYNEEIEINTAMIVASVKKN